MCDNADISPRDEMQKREELPCPVIEIMKLSKSNQKILHQNSAIKFPEPRCRQNGNSQDKSKLPKFNIEVQNP